jgi:hypothetical protein
MAAVMSVNARSSAPRLLVMGRICKAVMRPQQWPHYMLKFDCLIYATGARQQDAAGPLHVRPYAFHLDDYDVEFMKPHEESFWASFPPTTTEAFRSF